MSNWNKESKQFSRESRESNFFKLCFKDKFVKYGEIKWLGNILFSDAINGIIFFKLKSEYFVKCLQPAVILV